jgi:hypothetical protein
MPLMTPEAVDRVVEWRREQPILSGYQFGILAGVPISDVPPTSFLPFPGEGLILTLWTKNRPLERRIEVRKTPQSPDRPWIIDYDVELPRAARDDTEPDPDDLPISQLFPSIPRPD